MLIADQRRLTFLREIACKLNVNPILSTLGRLCDYDFRALATIYNIDCIHVSNSYKRCSDTRVYGTIWCIFVVFLSCMIFMCSVCLYFAVLL